MKITHHLGRFATFFKQSSLVVQLVIVVSAISIIAGTAMVAMPNNNEVSTNRAASDSSNVASDTDNQPSTNSDNEKVDEAPTDQTVTESTTSTQSQASTSSPSTIQPTQTNTSTTPQQTATVPTPTAPTCNESMKSSYTSLYNSQVNAENASWNNQINAWHDEATGRGVGGAFSGYVQGMIDQYKPAHDARLAQLQTQYYQNLASINCTP